MATTKRTTKPAGEPKAKAAASTTEAILAPYGSKADRQAAHRARQAALVGEKPPTKYSDDDNSIDARMWRLNQDHIEMGSRT